MDFERSENQQTQRLEAVHKICLEPLVLTPQHNYYYSVALKRN